MVDGRIDLGAFEAGVRVFGRHIFYNHSSFDGNDPAPTQDDDDAIAPDKNALLPGGTATFANYTSFDQGINGVIIDLLGATNATAMARFSARICSRRKLIISTRTIAAGC